MQPHHWDLERGRRGYPSEEVCYRPYYIEDIGRGLPAPAGDCDDPGFREYCAAMAASSSRDPKDRRRAPASSEGDDERCPGPWSHGHASCEGGRIAIVDSHVDDARRQAGEV